MPALDDDNLDFYSFKCSHCGQENLLAKSDLELIEDNHACERCGFDMVILNEREDISYHMSKIDLLLHADIVNKTNISSYCYLEDQMLIITNPTKYVECVNEYWKYKLMSQDVKWHSSNDVVQSVVDLTDYFRGLSHEIH